MTIQINKNLDYQKYLKFETQKSESNLKQSVSDIAHDLRTPLTVIKGNLQLLEDEKLSDKGISYLKVCSEKIDIIKNMADDFFELSVLESENIAVNLQKTDITTMIMQFIIDHESVIRKNNLIPEIKFPEKSIFVMADEHLMTRMLSNLLNNIIKYAHDKFSVEISENEDKCILTFANEIDRNNPPDINHIFDRTYRGDRSRHGNGAGLGLYIVKLLAEKQKINITAFIKDNKLFINLIFSHKKPA
jgi:signal transduction histidine kinase